MFRLFKVWKCRELKDSRILSVSFHEKSKEQIIMAVSSEHKMVVYLDIFEAFLSETAILTNNDDFIQYKILANGFHQKAISKLQCSI